MLPKFENKQYEFNINGKTIKFRPWKTKDEREFLILKESEGEVTFNQLYKSMALPCIEYDGELTQGEKQMILFEIRKKSYGESVDFNFTCGDCGSYNEAKFNIKDIVKYSPSDFKPQIKDGFTVTYKDPGDFDLTDVKEFDIEYYSFLYHIDTITYDNEVHKDFTIEELSEFFDDMPAELFDFFYSGFVTRIETIEYTAKSTCLNCKKEQDLEISQIPNLFPW